MCPSHVARYTSSPHNSASGSESRHVYQVCMPSTNAGEYAWLYLMRYCARPNWFARLNPDKSPPKPCILTWYRRGRAWTEDSWIDPVQGPSSECPPTEPWCRLAQLPPYLPRRTLGCSGTWRQCACSDHGRRGSCLTRLRTGCLSSGWRWQLPLPWALQEDAPTIRPGRTLLRLQCTPLHSWTMPRPFASAIAMW